MLGKTTIYDPPKEGQQYLVVTFTNTAAFLLTRQLHNIGRDPPRFVAGHKIGRCAPAGLLLVIDVRNSHGRGPVINRALL